MTVQAGLCWACSETTLLVFPRGGSNLAVSPGPCNIQLILELHGVLLEPCYVFDCRINDVESQAINIAAEEQKTLGKIKDINVKKYKHLMEYLHNTQVKISM